MSAFHELTRPVEHGPRRSTALVTVLAAVLFLAGGITLYLLAAPRVQLIAIELGGAGQARPLPPGTATALWWDLALVFGVGVALVLGTTAAIWVSWAPRAQQLSRFARIAALVAVLAAMLNDVLLLIATAAPDDVLLTLATTAAVVKFGAVLPAGLLTCYGIAVTLWRCLANGRRRLGRLAVGDHDGLAASPLEEGDFQVPAADELRATSRWRRGYQVPDAEPGTTGLCLSGGGIRAASVAMGALQSLRSRLLQARYLVSVSGGGYTSGALQQALTSAIEEQPVGEVLRKPESAYAQGGVEEDHVRRHVSYLADSTPETLTAFGVLGRGLLLSLIVLFAPAFVLGAIVGWLYREVPVTVPATATFPVFRVGALIALGVLVLGALGASLLARATAPSKELRQVLRRLATRLALLAVLVAGITVVIPVLVWFAYLLPTKNPGVRIGSPVGAVLLTYLSTLASILWRNRSKLGTSGTTTGITAALPSSLLQRVLVIVTTAVLALAWLLLFVVTVGADGDAATLWAALGFAVVLLIVGGIFDETSLSLHPFYRERLACTFAVRRVERDGCEIAVPYPSTERTTLSHYGRTDVKFPQVIFAAAANLTGEGRTPPGLSCVSYTMSADWVGGPDVGWVRTGTLEQVVPARFQRDLTVQGAVAISGAAFASAMGRSARWFQVLLAVSGSRLGAWLPNPGFVLAAPQHPQRNGWAYPGLPQARRLPYLWREVLGIHSHSDRLLHVTDGGHYDNLGLVELLRRRCSLIYCVDASVDEQPTATTLATALTLAEQELGVRVELHDPWQAEPGSGKPLDPEGPLSMLTARLVKSPVITGTIHYPPESGLPPQQRTAHLVVAKALLWRELPYPLLSYAAHHPEFPHDSTGDQFFDDGQFAAYTELGRRLGELVNKHKPPALTLTTQRSAGRRPHRTVRRTPTSRP
jgi:hypothetical protein